MNDLNVIDKTAFSLVYKTYINRLYSYGISLGYSHDICLDAIQDVFCKVYMQFESAKIDNIKYYLLRSLKNRLIDIQKINLREVDYHEVNDSVFITEVSVIEDIIHREEEENIKNKVAHLLSLLTNRQREAIYLRYMQELEYEEIGHLLNMNAESVRKLVYRGIEKLRQESEYDIPFLLFLVFRLFY